MTAAIVKSQFGFDVSGAITFDNVVAISRQGDDLIRTAQEKKQEIAVDLANMQEQNAAALALLLAWLRTANKQDVMLVFKNLSNSLQRMVTAFGLTELIEK